MTLRNLPKNLQSQDRVLNLQDEVVVNSNWLITAITKASIYTRSGASTIS